MTPDKLSADAITAGLETLFVGRTTLYYPSVTSTMDIARDEAQRGADEGTVIIAEEQTAARGRLKRAWTSPQGNIALSVILRPAVGNLPSLIMVSSLAVVRAIERVAGLRSGIKWPNDVLIGGRKVCGILIESSLSGTAVDHAILGIGLNVNLDVAAFPEIAETATSLRHELGKEISRVELLQALFAELEFFYTASTAGDAVYDQWRKRLVTLGQKVRAASPTGDSAIEGVAEAVARDGSLVLLLPDGSRTRVLAGDVTLQA
jgi:BirA family biotin operon repressor/biotin-[acetyl-CoA-carboxylase] ligase